MKKLVLFSVFIISIVAMFTGCSVTMQPKKTAMNYISVVNHNSGEITDVKISSNITNKSVTWSSIAANAQQSYSFTSTYQRSNSYTLTWKYKDTLYLYDSIKLANVNEGEAIRLSLNLLDEGKFFVHKL